MTQIDTERVPLSSAAINKLDFPIACPPIPPACTRACLEFCVLVIRPSRTHEGIGQQLHKSVKEELSRTKVEDAGGARPTSEAGPTPGSLPGRSDILTIPSEGESPLSHLLNYFKLDRNPSQMNRVRELKERRVDLCRHDSETVSSISSSKKSGALPIRHLWKWPNSGVDYTKEI